MKAFHQIGHDSENLISDPHCEGFDGAVLSPVNYSFDRVAAQIKAHGSDEFETIFDPQLYYPNSNRGKLHEWAYYPKNVHTGDPSSPAWWDALVSNLVSDMEKLAPSSVASPSEVPKVFNNEYYDHSRGLATSLASKLEKHSISVYQTVLVSLADLSQRERAEEIASIVSGCELDLIYLVLHGDVDPRREFNDSEALTGACKLLRVLNEAGMKVLVGYSSLDAILWLSCGAEAVASGKYFNLRRFTSGRWDEPSGGGGQLPYWTSLEFLSFFRQPDVNRLVQKGLLPNPAGGTDISKEIYEAIQSNEAWLAKSWRQYLKKFLELKNLCADPGFDADAYLDGVERLWEDAETAKVLMEERLNDGRWIRPWRIAINDSL